MARTILTVLLTRPTASLQAVVAEGEGPLGVRTAMKRRRKCQPSRLQRNSRRHGTYTLPESVEGGASRSGFCNAIGMFWGPKIFEPRVPRIPSGWDVESSVHKTPFGSSLAKGTVSDAGRADDVPLAVALFELLFELLFAAATLETETTLETALEATLDTALETALETALLAAACEDSDVAEDAALPLAAGAAEA